MSQWNIFIHSFLWYVIWDFVNVCHSTRTITFYSRVIDLKMVSSRVRLVLRTILWPTRRMRNNSTMRFYSSDIQPKTVFYFISFKQLTIDLFANSSFLHWKISYKPYSKNVNFHSRISPGSFPDFVSCIDFYSCVILFNFNLMCQSFEWIGHSLVKIWHFGRHSSSRNNIKL